MTHTSPGEPDAWLRAALDFILMEEPEECRTRMVPSPPTMPASPVVRLALDESYYVDGDSPDMNEDR